MILPRGGLLAGLRADSAAVLECGLLDLPHLALAAVRPMPAAFDPRAVLRLHRRRKPGLYGLGHMNWAHAA